MLKHRCPEACSQRRRESAPAFWAMEEAPAEDSDRPVLASLPTWMDAMSTYGRVTADGFRWWASRVGNGSETWY